VWEAFDKGNDGVAMSRVNMISLTVSLNSFKRLNTVSLENTWRLDVRTRSRFVGFGKGWRELDC